jgi:DNA-binding NarL/FixJ family response regulator
MGKQEYQEITMKTAVPPFANPERPRLRVLIVDDNPQVRHDLRQLLELTGEMEIVAEAGNGLEAVHLVGELCPEAVVMDLEMPGLDGYAATRLIKTQQPAPRVIILSVHTGSDEQEQARAAGADAFVMKGEHYEILVNAILGKNASHGSYDSEKGDST